MSARPSPPRAPLAIVAALAGLLVAGCAARPDRFARFGAEEGTGPAARRAEAPPRAGFASFGRDVRLREDTPSLTALLDADRDLARRRDFEEEMLRRSRSADEGLAGPQGACGPSCGPCGLTIVGGPYVAPIGVAPWGVRFPSDELPPRGAFADAFRAAPGSDVWSHRPGLSTGSGVFARDAHR